MCVMPGVEGCTGGPGMPPPTPSGSLSRSVHEVRSLTGTLPAQAHCWVGRMLFAMGRNGKVEVNAENWNKPNDLFL